MKVPSICQPMETLWRLSSLSVLPSSPTGAHCSCLRSSLGSCFWLQVAFSTAIFSSEPVTKNSPLLQVSDTLLSFLLLSDLRTKMRACFYRCHHDRKDRESQPPQS